MLFFYDMEIENMNTLQFRPDRSCSLLIWGIILSCSSTAWGEERQKPPSPLTEKKTSSTDEEQKWDKQILQATQQLISAYSSRGDAWFFKGEFTKAVNDYDAMITLNPNLKTSHWRRGIALFYAKEYEKSAHQFEMYHTFDNIDRENGIWRYFSQVKAYGLKKARLGLLKYEKDDREPFPSLYLLFSEKITPQEILDRIEKAQSLDKQEREKRLFYSHLYIGLNEAIHNRAKSARKHLSLAEQNRWGKQAGYGPHYMWEVGRLQNKLLSEKEARSKIKNQKK